MKSSDILQSGRRNLERAESAVGDGIAWTVEQVWSVLEALWKANERSLAKESEEIMETVRAIAGKTLTGKPLSLRDRFNLGNSRLAGEYFAELVVIEKRGQLDENTVCAGATVNVVELPEELQGRFKGGQYSGVHLKAFGDTSFMGDYKVLHPGQSFVLTEVIDTERPHYDYRSDKGSIIPTPEWNKPFLVVEIDGKQYGLTREDWCRAYYAGKVTFGQ